METLSLVKDILRTALQQGARVDTFDASSPLLGHFPELNSLTVMGIISGIEGQASYSINDAKITTELFEAVGSLAAFIKQKTG